MQDNNENHHVTFDLEDDKWIGIIAEWKESGLSVAEWIRTQEGINYSNFFHHKARLYPTTKDNNSELTWSSMDVALTSSIDVHINDCRIVVTPGFDKELLCEIVEVLKHVHPA